MLEILNCDSEGWGGGGGKVNVPGHDCMNVGDGCQLDKKKKRKKKSILLG